MRDTGYSIRDAGHSTLDAGGLIREASQSHSRPNKIVKARKRDHFFDDYLSLW
jgi:hypothetical protein